LNTARWAEAHPTLAYVCIISALTTYGKFGSATPRMIPRLLLDFM
jgi:hypothetical protein